MSWVESQNKKTIEYNTVVDSCGPMAAYQYEFYYVNQFKFLRRYNSYLFYDTQVSNRVSLFTSVVYNKRE